MLYCLQVLQTLLSLSSSSNGAATPRQQVEAEKLLKDQLAAAHQIMRISQLAADTLQVSSSLFDYPNVVDEELS